MKTVLIKQPAGLGDVFFCQKIALEFINKGHQVYWPVYDHILKNIFNYIKNDIVFIDVNSNFVFKNEYLKTNKGTIQEYENCIIVSTDGCPANGVSKYNLGVMLSKYKMVNLDYSNWAQFFKFERNKNKEKELFYNVLNLKNNDEFIFVNNNIGSNGHESIWNVPYPSNKKTIFLNFKEGFTLFDWCLVVEKAHEFYVMETSITYLIELLSTKASIYHMFARNSIDSLDFMDYTKMYTKKPWNFFDNSHKQYILK